MSKNIKKIFFIRHGQTDHNSARVFQSDTVGLNDYGVAQAKSVASKLVNIEVVISSPLLRAQETAKIIAEKSNSSGETTDLLTEFKNPPNIRGKSYDDPDTANIYNGWCSGLLETKSYGLSDTENYYDLIIRAKKVLVYLTKREEDSIVAVTHSELIRAVLACVLIGDNITPKIFNDFQTRVKVRNCVAVKLDIIKADDIYSYKLIFE